MSANKDEILERNLEVLVRRGALPLRPEGEARARAAFLERASGRPAPRRDSGKLAAVAASFLAGGIVLWSMLPSAPPRDASPDATGLPAPERPTSAEKEDPPEIVVREGEGELAVRASAWTDARPSFRVKGRIPAEDGTVLSVVFQRQEEAYREGRLVAQKGRTSSGRVQVASKAFSVRLYGDLGPYQATVLDLEGPDAGKRWSFRVHVSGPRFERRLSRDYDEAVGKGREARELVKAFETASANEQTWLARRTPLEQEARLFLAELQQVEARTLCTASIRELSSTVGVIVSAVPLISWEEEKLRVKTYYENGKDLKTHRDEKFSFPTFRRYVEEAIVLAGRESLLCVIRERRNGRELEAPLEAFLERLGRVDALSRAADRLRGPDPDLSALEKAVRGGP